MSTVFTKIIAGEIPADVVYEDDLVLAFRDIAPSAPTHILIIPKHENRHRQRSPRRGRSRARPLFIAAAKIAAEEGIAADGYRLIVNCNAHGGQEVFHLHMHLVGGRSLGPMLARR